jgi:hypothetical protein
MPLIPLTYAAGTTRPRNSWTATPTGNDNVTVFLNNGRYLDIGLVNSPWKSLPPAAKAAKAGEVAGVAVAAYPERSSLARINVTYTTNRTYFLVVHYTDTTDLQQARAGSPQF